VERMKSITVKLDEATFRQLQEAAEAGGIKNQSELVRRALKTYLARESLAARKQAVADYAADAGAQQEAVGLAETGLDDLKDYLEQIEEGDA